MLTDATAKNLSLAQTLEALVDRELEARHQRSIERRFKLSRLQSMPSIDSFSFNHHKSRLQLKTRILRLLDLDFLHNDTIPNGFRMAEDQGEPSNDLRPFITNRSIWRY
jgi:hypothetical protein